MLSCVLAIRCDGNGFLREGSLLHVKTSAVVVDSLPTVTATAALPPGCLISGVDAAIINFCEARALPALLLVAVRRSSISADAMRAFERALPLLRQCLGSNVVAPTIDKYREAIKKDKFVMKTESLYC